ncbi:type VI secretion system baseplate subunit TssE [Rubripirellula reticaptiva]|uniref:Lysozyme-like protein n=1 Tax=Rubripirellula reticaptiva TaxID=2528013 RepID=A0A5C6F4L4_9BACT|nr:type VI secretion system baseplate subunit TssE [Rubripirellula reticaptiva]TWU56288.1 lysozyme-like protein [Rubripirellula reticaptiva]
MPDKQRIDHPTSSLLDRLIGNNDVSNGALRLANGTTAGEVSSAASSPVAVTSPTAGLTRRQHAKQLAILRSQIERDLLALFGTRRLSEDTDLSAWPLVQKSVLNYGVPDLTGSTGSGVDVRRLQRELTDAIKCFEPRLRPATLTVTCRVNEHSTDELSVDIEALFGPSDALESFAMGISINLGSGQCRAVDPKRLRRTG